MCTGDLRTVTAAKAGPYQGILSGVRDMRGGVGLPRDGEVGVGGAGLTRYCPTKQGTRLGSSSPLPCCVTLTTVDPSFSMGKMRKLDHLLIGAPFLIRLYGLHVI